MMGHPPKMTPEMYLSARAPKGFCCPTWEHLQKQHLTFLQEASKWSSDLSIHLNDLAQRKQDLQRQQIEKGNHRLVGFAFQTHFRLRIPRSSGFESYRSRVLEADMRSRSPPALGRRPPARDRDVTDVRDVRAPSPGVPGPSCAVTISRRSVLLSPRCARPPNVWEDNDDEELIQRKKQKKQFEKKQKKQVSDDGDGEEAPEERAIQICRHLRTEKFQGHCCIKCGHHKFQFR